MRHSKLISSNLIFVNRLQQNFCYLLYSQSNFTMLIGGWKFGSAQSFLGVLGVNIKMDQSALATPKTIKRLCPRCNLYTTEAIHVHLKKCTQCQRCGRYKTHLKVHLQTCKGVGKVQRVTCPVCPRTYHPRSLGRHLRKEHPTEIWTSGSRKHRKETVQCVKGREQVSHCNHNN
jgi:hypothetical protein